MNDHVTRAEFERLESTVDTLRISREARLQNIEYHLEKIVQLFERFFKFAPWILGLMAILEIFQLWVGYEGWRRP
jgi:hypothetical protein